MSQCHTTNNLTPLRTEQNSITVRTYSAFLRYPNGQCIHTRPHRQLGHRAAFFSCHVPAGFPSPAQDHMEQALSLDALQYSVIIEKTARELRGTPCIALEEAAPAKQGICSSRAFGERLRTIEPIREAVATYTTRACEKLRAQGSRCNKVRVSIRTGMFNPDEAKYAKGVVCELPYPTDDTRLIIRAAIAGLDQVFREGHAYAKAEILLLDLRQQGEFTDDLFAEVQPAAAERVMGVLDQINWRWGKGTLRPASVPDAPGWRMKREMISASYTSNLSEVLKVLCQ